MFSFENVLNFENVGGCSLMVIGLRLKYHFISYVPLKAIFASTFVGTTVSAVVQVVTDRLHSVDRAFLHAVLIGAHTVIDLIVGT